jgi:hypothetical protein
MRAGDVIASAGTRRRLGRSLGEVCGWLWPQDCQTCGRALDGRPALCVDDNGAFATASLHHPQCRAATWNESARMPVSGAAGLSWTSRAWTDLALVRREEGLDPRPFLLVNPGLEMVFLRRSDDGWEPEIAKPFPAAGLQPVGEVEVGRPLAGLAATLSHGKVTVRFRIPPFDAYSSTVDDSFTARARAAGGLLFGVTHLVNPADPVTADQMDMLMLAGPLLMGWAGLSS